jgi:6-phosphogluconolactonase
MNQQIFPSTPHTAEACAEHILKLLEQAAASRAATLAISGGSSPRLMFEIFAKTRFPWDRVQLFWVDERYVPHTDPQSNFKLANDAWLAPAGFPPSNIHAVDASLPKDEAARRYAQDIRDCFELRPGELPQFDVIHQGMGPDCHTASLFPGEPLIDDRTGLAAAVWVEKMKQWRVTILPGVLLAARHTVMLITGDDKAEALRTVLHGPYDPKLYPAQLVARDCPNTDLFMDQAAARLIQ